MCQQTEYLYTNIIHILIFINFWSDILCQHDEQSCSYSNNRTKKHPGAPIVCTQPGVSGLSPLFSRWKGTLNSRPTILFVAIYFKELQ